MPMASARRTGPASTCDPEMNHATDEVSGTYVFESTREDQEVELIDVIGGQSVRDEASCQNARIKVLAH